MFEAKIARQMRLLVAACSVLGIVVVILIADRVTARQGPSTVTVSSREVVDPGGVVRVRIGGDLPDAVIDGQTTPRGQQVAGVMLYDNTGERVSNTEMMN